MARLAATYRKPYSRTRLIFRPTWCTLHFVNLKKKKKKTPNFISLTYTNLLFKKKKKNLANRFSIKSPTDSLKGAPRRHVSQTLLENTLNFSPNVVYLAFR